MKNKIPYYSSLDGIYMNLHWLKVKFRIIYKILLIVHNCLHDKAPNEVSALIKYSESERTMKLSETRANNGYGNRAFSHMAPKLWNLLPSDIRSEHSTQKFKKMLKSFLITRGNEFLGWTKRQ